MTTQFASALELATYFDGTTDITKLTPEWIAQANLLLQMISADIESAAGRPIEAGSGTLVLPGTWSRDLELPIGPLRSISAVTVNGIAVDAGSYFFNDRTVIRRSSVIDDPQDYPESPAAIHQGAASRAGITWQGPASTVVLEVGWGFDEVPGIVKSLALRIAARTFGNVSQLTQETLAIYSVSYGSSTNTNDGSHVTDSERKRLRSALNRIGGTIEPAGR